MIFDLLFAIALLGIWFDTSIALFLPVKPLVLRLLLVGGMIAWAIVYLDDYSPESLDKNT